MFHSMDFSNLHRKRYCAFLDRNVRSGGDSHYEILSWRVRVDIELGSLLGGGGIRWLVVMLVASMTLTVTHPVLETIYTTNTYPIYLR